jgi:hypothetical protein
MPRATLLLALAIILQTSPTAQNGAPAISLATQPARQVYGVGERFTIVASASDDHDAPDKLQYLWTVKNVESGVEQAARSMTLREVTTRGRAVGRYQYKCRVTDTAGLSGEASLVISIEDTGQPEVASVEFDDSTAALHHVKPYWREGFPAVRRGDWATLLVLVRNFVGGPHFLQVFVDGKAVTGGVPGSTWAAQNLGGTTTEQRVRLFVPPDVAVGKHTIEVAAIKRANADGPESETSRASFSSAPLVLFNPWRSVMPDAAVHAAKPLQNPRATFYTRGTQDAIMSGLASKTVYDVTPSDKAVVSRAQEIVASMPADARSDAARVAAAMAAAVGEKPGPAPNAITLTSLLRSIGIPARTVTVLGAGHDLEAEWGVLQTKYDCKKWSGPRCDDPQIASAEEQVASRSWNEAWIPSVNQDDGWVVVDADRKGGGIPSVKAVREYPPIQRGQQIPATDDAAFVYGEVNLPWEIWWKTQDNSWFQATGGPGNATHAFVTDSGVDRQDELTHYGVSSEPSDAQKANAVQITVGPVVSVRAMTAVRLTASGASTPPQRLGIAVLRGGGLVFATIVDARATGNTWSDTVEIPGDALSVAGPYEVVVGPQVGTTGPSGRARFDVRSLPIVVALPTRVNAGATFAVSARLVNASSAPVQDVSLKLVLPSQLRVISGAGTGTKPVIPPAGDLRVDAMVQAIASGTFTAGAAAESSAGAGEEQAQVTVGQPGTLQVAGETALGIKTGEPVTVTANVMLDGMEPLAQVEATLESIDGAPLSIVGEARKLTDALAPDDLWTPSWQVLVTAPGTYRLPVRVRTAGLGETRGEILLIAGETDPDANVNDDFNDDESLGYRSLKAIAGVAAAVAALVFGAIYWIKRKRLGD